MSFADQDRFIRFLEITWGVGENEEDLTYKGKVSSLINNLRESLLFLDGDIAEKAKLTEFFTRFDSDKDGQLTLKEFETMIATLEVEYERSHLSGLMSRLDIDHTTTLSIAEFERVVKEQIQ